jgi:hypothetical protein
LIEKQGAGSRQQAAEGFYAEGRKLLCRRQKVDLKVGSRRQKDCFK